MFFEPSGVIRVAMQVLPQVGTQPSESPLLGGGQTPVRVAQFPGPASGAEIGSWSATGGAITVERATDTGRAGHYGLVSGTLDVTLTQNGGAKPIRITGAWGCVIDPDSN